MAGSAGKGKGSKKIGRKVPWCKNYRLQGKREKNKAKKVAKHVKKYPNDVQAAKVLARGFSPRNNGRAS